MIAGPTAVGKTPLAIALARHYRSAIISADSRQFYRQMNIGTAKPDAVQLSQAQHFFVNNKNINELYGAGHFQRDVLQKLGELFESNNVVLMAGGSGLYVDAVLNGVDDFVETPAGTREKLNSAFKENGLLWLQQEVKKYDPSYFDSVDRNNPQRLIRALEVFEHSGLPYSSFLNKQKNERSFIPVKILVNTARELLYTRINARVDEMMKKGLLEEVKSLSAFRQLNALKTVGYKELYDYLDGNCSLENAVDKIKQHTRNYAKRQLTWFKNRDQFTEFEPGALEEIIAFINAAMSDEANR